jgi:hypothetical protein
LLDGLTQLLESFLFATLAHRFSPCALLFLDPLLLEPVRLALRQQRIARHRPSRRRWG